MGTRGFYCVKLNGKYYIFYNNWGNGPSGLGTEIASQINQNNLLKWKQILDNHTPRENLDTETIRIRALQFYEEVMPYLSYASFHPKLTMEILQSAEAFKNWGNLGKTSLGLVGSNLGK